VQLNPADTAAAAVLLAAAASAGGQGVMQHEGQLGAEHELVAMALHCTTIAGQRQSCTFCCSLITWPRWATQ
jgi:hypothetical protein